MPDDIDLRLGSAKENLLRKKRLQSEIGLLDQWLDLETSRKERLKNEMHEELIDLKKIERPGLTALFHAILDNREHQLEKEREEYLRAKLSFDECSSNLENLKLRRAAAKEEIADLGNPEDEYAALILEKKAFIAECGSPEAEKLFELAEAIAEKDSKKLEVLEALAAGEKLLGRADEMQEVLSEALGWGVLDQLGGGILTTGFKYFEIDRAKEISIEIQQLLRTLGKELKDINMAFDTSLEIDNFSTFSDYFFDGLIIDWYIQNKLENSAKRISYLRGYVSGIMKSLREKALRIEKEKEELALKRACLIENA